MIKKKEKNVSSFCFKSFTYYIKSNRLWSCNLCALQNQILKLSIDERWCSRYLSEPKFLIHIKAHQLVGQIELVWNRMRQLQFISTSCSWDISEFFKPVFRLKKKKSFSTFCFWLLLVSHSIIIQLNYISNVLVVVLIGLSAKLYN